VKKGQCTLAFFLILLKMIPKFNLLLPLLSAFFFILTSCSEKPKTLFKLLANNQTGVNFENTIVETDSFNILTYEYIYNGGGVALADFNNDSKVDIFFSGNQVPNCMYLNQGDLKFIDVSNKANINIPGRWNSGVSAVDINADGWMDVYVCATMSPDSIDRKNMLFVNQGIDKMGEPTFKEMAEEYNLDFSGHSVSSAFFDFDKDGDLDLYILVNVQLNNAPTNFRKKINDGSAANNDRLFRNDGNGKFIDISISSGIVHEGFGLGLAINDFNNDGWPDIYVSNDYQSNDILYINEKNGTFKNRISEFMRHQSQFSMGNDAADINNDGLVELITLDMLPESSERKKTTIGNKTYQTYINNEKFNYEYQYVRNMLQLNNGSGRGIAFSEIGQLAGVFQTDWSWSPLFVDFDNDGFRDLAITNGFPKDITDKDFANYRSSIMNLASPGYLVDSIPVIKIPNYAFKNNGDLTFTDVSNAWGLNEPSFSNGAAFADLDNDGDVDYVVNNINASAFVYENTLYSSSNSDQRNTHFLRVKLIGSKYNLMGLGAKLTLYYDSSKMQYHDHSVYRGYLSSVENIVHFGLGPFDLIDSLVVVWPDGKSKTLEHIKANQIISANYEDANQVYMPNNKSIGLYFSEVQIVKNIAYLHSQDDFIDFNIQRTLPHKYSQFGPSLTVGDIDKDGLEDFFVGGSSGYEGQFFIQQKNGGFKPTGKRLFNSVDGQKSDDVGAILFDFDGDDDVDLYIIRGGFNMEINDPSYQDVLYINDGKGFFTISDGLLPFSVSSGGCIRSADYDKDGDLDLFVGGRVQPSQYPFPPESYILRNDKGKYVDVTHEICPAIKEIGMVTDAIWSDFDNDGRVDLIIAGELMSVKLIRNNGVSFKVLKSEIDNYKGWWNSIAASDFDLDGDVDFVIGNLGLNNPFKVKFAQPLKVIAKDIDSNGSIDAITGCYTEMQDGSVKLCPVHFWDEINQQSPRFRKQFSSYKQFSKTTFKTLFTKKDLEGALALEANYSATSYFENLGKGEFKISPLPAVSQIAPVNGIVAYDVNQDGYMDVVMVGNDYGNEVFAGRYDAFTGLVLLGNGKGSFDVVSSAKSGFYIPGDAKSLVTLSGSNGDIFIASQNRDSLKIFSTLALHDAVKFKPEPLDSWSELVYADGRIQKVEFYYGSGYLSQSTRAITIPKKVREIIVYDSKGKSRRIVPSGL
jgi:enediyne biosynthesis protein E4